jgi:hypothetical protein
MKLGVDVGKSISESIGVLDLLSYEKGFIEGHKAGYELGALTPLHRTLTLSLLNERFGAK